MAAEDLVRQDRERRTQRCIRGEHDAGRRHGRDRVWRATRPTDASASVRIPRPDRRQLDVSGAPDHLVAGDRGLSLPAAAALSGGVLVDGHCRSARPLCLPRLPRAVAFPRCATLRSRHSRHHSVHVRGCRGKWPRNPRSAPAEFRMAVAGLVASLVLAALFAAAWSLGLRLGLPPPCLSCSDILPS